MGLDNVAAMDALIQQAHVVDLEVNNVMVGVLHCGGWGGANAPTTTTTSTLHGEIATLILLRMRRFPPPCVSVGNGGVLARQVGADRVVHGAAVAHSLGEFVRLPTSFGWIAQAA